jgi:hypothetical protein
MTEELDNLLEHALRDGQGRIVSAHLQRAEEDYWDRLVVGRDGQPFTFRGRPTGMSDEVVLEDGSILMVLACTPSGVSPEGHLAVPADESGSPLAKMVAVVDAEGLTEVEPPDQQPAKPPPLGPDSFTALLQRAAMRQGDEIGVTKVEAVDGGVATVVVAWDQRPLLLWFEKLGGSGRELMCISALPGGLVATSVDSTLRPLHSDDRLAQLLADEA